MELEHGGQSNEKVWSQWGPGAEGAWGIGGCRNQSHGQAEVRGAEMKGPQSGGEDRKVGIFS